MVPRLLTACVTVAIADRAPIAVTLLCLATSGRWLCRGFGRHDDPECLDLAGFDRQRAWWPRSPAASPLISTRIGPSKSSIRCAVTLNSLAAAGIHREVGAVERDLEVGAAMADRRACIGSRGPGARARP